jgi:hypothetical protein
LTVSVHSGGNSGRHSIAIQDTSRIWPARVGAPAAFDSGVFVECETVAPIPLYRIVHLQLERAATQVDGVPSRLREGRVLSAIWRVAPCRRSTGTPSGYALRFLVDPNEAGMRGHAQARMLVAS